MRIFAVLLLAGTLNAENLFQIQGANFIELSSCRFKLTTSFDTDSFSLKDPNRFVVDILGAKIKKNDNIEVESECITGVRVGTHPKFVRLVFDLKDNVIGEFNNGEILLYNPQKALISTLPPPTLPSPTLPPPTPLPSPTLPPATNTQPIPTLLPTQAVPTSTPTVHTPTKSLVGKEKVLTKIEFLAHGARVTFSSEISFKQSKGGVEVFKIHIPGASLGSEKVRHPFFAPQDIPGIVSIVPIEASDGVTLEIIVERNTQVFAYRDGNHLEIRKG